MKKLMHALFLSCLRATELIEKRFNIELSIKEKIQLKMHTAMCKACAAYQDQSAIIDKSLQQTLTKKATNQDTKALKQKINEAINNKD